MKKDDIESLFKNLEGSFDIAEPAAGHQQRFLDKLGDAKETQSHIVRKRSWWKPMAIAASVALLISVGIITFNNTSSVADQVAEISPEISNSQRYFTSLIEEQIKEIENQSTPETEKIIEDTMLQLKRLEKNYMSLEKQLLEGGNSKLILSAMITNFQTRISLLQDVLDQIGTIKNIKTYSDENTII